MGGSDSISVLTELGQRPNDVDVLAKRFSGHFPRPWFAPAKPNHLLMTGPCPSNGINTASALPQRTEFAVIGSDITGCSVTKALPEQPGASESRVTVIEARTLVSRATGRNGGRLVTASGHTFGSLARQHGVEAAKQITRFSILNIERVMSMAREMDQGLQHECQIRDVLKVMAVGDEETWIAAKSSVLDFQKAVPQYQTYHRVIDKEDVPKMWNIKDSSGAVEPEAGAVWLYCLFMGIFEQLLKKHEGRLLIEANNTVVRVEFSPTTDKRYPYLITTTRGVMRAKKIFHCTNAYASHLLPRLAGRIYPFRGTMSVQNPGPAFKEKSGTRSWSPSHKASLEPESGFYDTGLYYLQQNPLTGEIWIGNESGYMRDILTSDDTYVPKEAKEYLSTGLPRLFLAGWGSNRTSEVEAIWLGIQGYTADGLLIVGKVPSPVLEDAADDGQWYAAGFNGYGMDKCWLTGEALVRMMLGEDVSD